MRLLHCFSAFLRGRIMDAHRNLDEKVGCLRNMNVGCCELVLDIPGQDQKLSYVGHIVKHPKSYSLTYKET